MIMTPIKKHELLFKAVHSGTLEKNQSKKFLEFSPTLLQIEEDNKSIKHCFLFFGLMETLSSLCFSYFSPYLFNHFMIVMVMFYKFRSDQIRSVAQSCLTLCDPMNCSTPGLPVPHQLLEFTETHVHRVSDAIQPSHPLSSPSPLAPNPSQHQSLF